MSKSVGVLGVHQSWSERPYRHISKEERKVGLRCRRFVRVDDVTVQEVPGPVTDGRLGTATALPFSRRANPMIAPHKLHYSVPHADDVGLRRHNLFHYRDTQGELRIGSRTIAVSSRIAPEIRALECVPLPHAAARPGFDRPSSD